MNIFPSHTRSVAERVRDTHSAVKHVSAMIYAQLDVNMRLFNESLQFIVFSVVFDTVSKSVSELR